ncbi:ABC transporter ATP-binding protein [soil metagenome]|nr:ABC transporter ATP-binding protein [Trueperaceae bacterium]
MAIGLEARSLTKRFGQGPEGVTAVNDVSFEIEEGELFSLLGESGCGKTTILRMIAGLEKVTSGTILFSGQDYTHVPPNRRELGMVFQSYALYPHMSVFENVAYGLRIRGTNKTDVTEKVRRALDIVDLPPDTFSQRRPSELSGGQQQRIALARALVYDPRLLLFDEPLSNLDAKLRVYMREEIRKVQQRAGITAIYVTHDQEEALAISDRVAVMFEGVIEQIGTPVEVYDRPASAIVADFIGKANLFSATLTSKTGTGAVARTAAGDVVHGFVNEEAPPSGDDVTVMIRPERLTLRLRDDDAATAANGSTNSLDATIRSLSYLGSRTRYGVETAGGTSLTVDSVRYLERATPGAAVRLSFPAQDTLFLRRQELQP